MNRIAKLRSIQTSLTTRKSLPVLQQLGWTHQQLNSSNRSNRTDFSPPIIGKRYVSSFSEPEPTLFKLDPEAATSLSSTNGDDDDVDKQLRADVRTMGSILGSTIQSYEGEDILNKIESLRLAAKVWLFINL